MPGPYLEGFLVAFGLDKTVLDVGNLSSQFRLPLFCFGSTLTFGSCLLLDGLQTLLWLDSRVSDFTNNL